MPFGDSLSPLATMVLMIPLGILLAMALFGVDERLAAPRGARHPRMRFCEVGRDGRAELTDPDGHIWQSRKSDSDTSVEGGWQEG